MDRHIIHDTCSQPSILLHQDCGHSTWDIISQMAALLPKCDNGHAMSFTTWELGDNPGTQYEAGWFCDLCGKGAETGASGRYCCMECEVDCCADCLSHWEGGSCLPGSEEQLWEEGLIYEKLTAGRKVLPASELEEWVEVKAFIATGFMRVYMLIHI